MIYMRSNFKTQEFELCSAAESFWQGLQNTTQCSYFSLISQTLKYNIYIYVHMYIYLK